MLSTDAYNVRLLGASGTVAVASVAAKLLLYYSNLFNRLGIIANQIQRAVNAAQFNVEYRQEIADGLGCLGIFSAKYSRASKQLPLARGPILEV